MYVCFTAKQIIICSKYSICYTYSLLHFVAVHILHLTVPEVDGHNLHPIMKIYGNTSKNLQQYL